MAIRASVTVSAPIGVATAHESPLVGLPLIAGPSAGPFSEYEEFAWAGYEFARANQDPSMPSRQEIQGAQLQAWRDWWNQIRGFLAGMRPEHARTTAFVAGANVRPAWLADP